MRIREVEVIPISIAFRGGPFLRSYGEGKPLSVIVRLHCDNGLVGLGEASASPELQGVTLAAQQSLIADVLAPAVIGLDPRNLTQLHEAMDLAIPPRSAARQAKAAVDMAAHDVAGKYFNVPVSTLLGGAKRDKIEVVGSSIGVSNPADAAAKAKELLDAGHSTVKIKGSRSPAHDLEVVAAVRRDLGFGVVIRLDPNEGYQDIEEALPVLRRMDNEFRVELIEQPLPRHDLFGASRLANALGAALVVHQALQSAEDAATFIRYGAADVFNIAVQIVGGLRPARAIVQTAESFGVPVLIGSTRDFSIGDAASAHLASTVRALPFASDCRFHIGYVDDVTLESVYVKDGFTHVPTGPGLGVEVDEAKLARYRID